MGTIMHIDTSKATSDPEAVFGHPVELVEHIGLTRGQKIGALERWAAELESRLAGEHGGEAASLLADVQRGLETLRKDGDVVNGAAVAVT